MTETSENLTVYRYPLGSLVPDYLRSALGVGLLVVPFTYSFGAHWFVTIMLGGMLALFGSFGVSTAIRQYSVVLVDEHGLRQQGPKAVGLPWNEITEVDLRYFSTRRDKDKGWYQLKVTGPGGQLKADSNLEDFDGLLHHVATAVTRHDLPLSPIARENFMASGYSLSGVDNQGEGNW